MRLHDSGNLYVQGTLNPGGADFAEMLPAESGLEPGDVLAIGADGPARAQHDAVPARRSRACTRPNRGSSAGQATARARRARSRWPWPASFR